MAINKAVELNKEVQDKIDEEMPSDRSCFTKGYGGAPSTEAIPELEKRTGDVVIPEQPGKPLINANVVLTKDRNASVFSGYGKDNTQCFAIDIVVGRMGNQPRAKKVDPNFTFDAARIYISQRADIDKYFKLIDGTVGNAETKSAIALKADGIRLVAREGIKLVTGLDKKNSQDGDNKSIVGIDLIAGNKEMDKEGKKLLQPLVKGMNLVQALTSLVRHVDKLNGVVDHFLTAQMDFNTAICHHYHYSPWYGNTCTPSDSCVSKGIKTQIDMLQQDKRSLVTQKTNLVNYRKLYLGIEGKYYINSRWNNTN